MIRPVTTLLVANRGEIAIRIMRTARRMGIRTVAVYSDADHDALHTGFADAAIRIGPAAARESYLRPEAILEAARRSGADAIHPGYGFLSEKPDLPLLCEQAGLLWVGPAADRIAAMGPKIGAKRIAAAAGVPSVPGYGGDDQSTAALTDAAHRTGFPLMVKASAGGGGKGMRRVFEAAGLASALDIARREAEAAFGDPALLLEKLVLRPRHLEVQVAGDKHGGVVHLWERDCSVQRNNQKVLEEAPAPNLHPAIRQMLLDRAVALARAIAYDNLGTIEFILEEGAAEPWFLEMNTRLQVEHPVTEAITGLDLVEWQIRIARGEALPLSQAAVPCHGHAIEARITAERADQDFHPDAGRILAYEPPDNLRVESGVAAGSEVTLHYDSLLAKLIAAGDTREDARARLLTGLRQFSILGPATTLPFLADAVAHPVFAAGRATTGFIADAFQGGWASAGRHRALAHAVAAVLAAEPPRANVASPWSSLAGFRVLGPAGGLAQAHIAVDGEDVTVEALGDGRRRVGPSELRLECNGSVLRVEVDGQFVNGSYAMAGERVHLHLAGEYYTVVAQPAVRAWSRRAGGTAGSGAVLSPMPGVVAEVRVAAGDAVEAGQVVAVLESMKLFTSLAAAFTGQVTRVDCRPGETVPAGKLLVVIEPPG